MPNTSRHLAAILFADIAGYTALMGADEDRAFQAINHFKSVGQPLVEAHNGQWHKDLGDGALCSFGSALEAVQSAIEIQQRLNKEADYKVRIGIHLGDVTFQDGDVFGDGVNIASRIQGEAAEGGICVSEGVYNTIKNKEEIEAEYMGNRKMKNVGKAMGLYQLRAQGLSVKASLIRRKISWPILLLAASAFAVFGWFMAWNLKPDPSSSTQRFQISLPEDKPAIPFGWLKFNAGQKSIAVSPNGENLVYVSFQNNNSYLLLRSINSYDIKVLQGTENAYFPFWSPDSEWIGFFADGFLKKMHVSGGQPITLTKVKQPDGASWGDNDRIIIANAEGLQIISISSSGQDYKIIANNQQETLKWPFVLPGGNDVLISDLWGSIYLFSLTSGKSELLLKEAGWCPTYISEGFILYAPPGRIMAIPFDIGSKRITGEPIPLLDGIRSEEFFASQYSISENGTLAYIPGSPVSTGYLIWVDHFGVIVDSIPIPAARFGEFSISPDGNKIAYVKGVFQPEIWVYDRVSGINRLFTTEGDGLAPRWGNNGREIIFSSSRDNGLVNLYKKSIQNNHIERLTFENSKQWLWSESISSKQILAYYRDLNIWALDLNNPKNESQNITNSDFVEWGTAFSPDGDYFAFSSDEMGEYNIFIQPFPTTGQRWQISSGGGIEPLWSSSGDFIYFKGKDYKEMYAVNVKTKPEFSHGKPSLLFKKEYMDIGGRSHDISPDGKLFLMARRVDRKNNFHEIHVITNWFEELNRLAPPPD